MSCAPVPFQEPGHSFLCHSGTPESAARIELAYVALQATTWATRSRRHGGRSGTRTRALLLRRQPLFPLSYPPIAPPARLELARAAPEAAALSPELRGSGAR